jgi:hypothetical protein
LSGNAAQGAHGIEGLEAADAESRGARISRATAGDQLRVWLARTSRGERWTLAAAVGTTLLMAGVLLVSFYFALDNYVIRFAAWPG